MQIFDTWGGNLSSAAYQEFSLAYMRKIVSGLIREHEGKRLNLLLDVGHNPHAAQYLARRLSRTPPVGRRLAVFGLLADKDLDGVVAPLLDDVQAWAVAPLDSPRSRPAVELEAALQNLGASVASYASVTAALEAQCTVATPDDEILLFGSFYCVAEALSSNAMCSFLRGATGQPLKRLGNTIK